MNKQAGVGKAELIGGGVLGGATAGAIAGRKFNPVLGAVVGAGLGAVGGTFLGRNKQAALEEIYQSAFRDEMEKVGIYSAGSFLRKADNSGNLKHDRPKAYHLSNLKKIESIQNRYAKRLGFKPGELASTVSLENILKEKTLRGSRKSIKNLMRHEMFGNLGKYVSTMARINK